MNIVKSEPNIDKALTKNDVLLITKKEYEQLKKISKQLTKYLEKEYLITPNESGFTNHFIETLVRNTKNNLLTESHKEIIIANILFPEDEKIADLINDNNFTYEHINFIIDFRALLKKHSIHNMVLDNESKLKFETYKQLIDQIISIFEKNFRVTNQTIILNKLCEILVNKPHYFNEISTPTRKI